TTDTTVLSCHMDRLCLLLFLDDAATPEIYTLSLHDALPIYSAAAIRGNLQGEQLDGRQASAPFSCATHGCSSGNAVGGDVRGGRSEEHTSELQSRENLVCRLLLEKKKQVASVRISPTPPDEP